MHVQLSLAGQIEGQLQHHRLQGLWWYAFARQANALICNIQNMADWPLIDARSHIDAKPGPTESSTFHHTLPSQGACYSQSPPALCTMQVR